MSESKGPSIPLIKADLPPMEAVEDAFREILSNGRVTNFGPYLQQFEREIGDYLGTNACCLSSATAGLIITLQALEIPRGSRIIIPSFTFVATAQAVLYAGCMPVFVDVANDGNADLDDLARVLRTTPNVGAVILVHMYGLPCRTDQVETIVRLEEARRNQRIPVLYDGAHAFGSSRNGVRVGGAGHAEIFSTSVTKVMTSVEGGIVSTQDMALVDKLRKMRNYGIFANYDAHFPGLNGKMSEFHAIVGIQNLRRLDALLEARKQKAAFYTKQIQALTSFRVMTAPSGVLSTYKDYTIQLSPGLKAHRDAIMQTLAARGIETRAYFYPPVHEQKFFRTYADRPLPMTEDLSRRVITLPFSSTITEAEMQTVAEALAQAEASVSRHGARQEVRGMKILVTGGAGYLGSVLVPKLLARGHQVRVVDLGYFGLDHLRRLWAQGPTNGLETPRWRRVEVIREDLRSILSKPNLGRELMDGCDAVIHLAAISNDPSADLHPDLTDEVNVAVTARLAEQARRDRIRFLFSSSCSIYGEAEGQIDESGATNALTVYAGSKVTAERILGELADPNWTATVLRNGTLFGFSPRMRFDLVVNIFSFQSVLYGQLKVFGDGMQWRPFLHVSDCARAFIHFLENPDVRRACYNVANENLRVIDLVKTFRALNPRLEVVHVATEDQDRRNYRVSNRRMLDSGFRPRVSVEQGAEEMVDAIVSGAIPDPESIFYRNAKWLKELSQIGSMGHRELVGLIETFKHMGPEVRGA